MGIEGSVEVRVGWDGQRITEAAVRSQRPQVAGRLLVGLPPDVAAARVPLVYSLCARAQGLAAGLALDAAQGVEAMPSASMQVAVAAEAVHESMWRMLGDWPTWLGEAPDTSALVAMRKALQTLLAGRSGAGGVGNPEDAAQPAIDAGLQCQRILERRVLGLPMADWLQQSAAAAWRASSPSVGARILRAAAALRGACEAATLPAAAAEDLMRGLKAGVQRADFAARPDWEGAVVETGPVARIGDAGDDWAPTGGQWRLWARLKDAVDRVGALSAGRVEANASAARDDAGRGWAVVETARGLLIHIAAMAGDRVTSYRIIAPTEWNFHPQGVLPSLLTGVEAPDRETAERLAGLAVQALDPCVQYQVEVVDA